MGWFLRGINILETNKDAIQVFSSFCGEPKYFLFILYAVFRHIPTVVLVEPYSTESVGYFKEEWKLVSFIKVNMRPFLYRITAFIINTLQKANNFCILSISEQAKLQMIKAGFRKEQIFPFGYFIPKDPIIKIKQKMHEKNLRLIYVGALIKRKGIDIAIEAMNMLSSTGYNITLDCYGTGDLSNICSFIPSCVTHKGSFQYGEAQKIISTYDALILPSRHDGWGS